MADGGIWCDKALGDRQVWGVDEFVPSGKDADGVAVAFTAFGEGSEVLCNVVDGGKGGS